jgi:sulfite exporter TauE/SafE
MDLIGPASAGFFLGLASGPACFVSCAPALLPMVVTQAPGVDARRSAWAHIAQFLGGRLAAYILVGAISGGLGPIMEASGLRFAGWAALCLGVMLIALGIGPPIPLRACTILNRHTGMRLLPFLFGTLTGLNVCPPFLAAVAYTLERGAGAISGMLFFFAFFVATSLYLLPIGFTPSLPNRKALAFMGRLAAILMGAYLVHQWAASQ